MSLFKCPECGHDISTSALACPNCGWRNIPPNPSDKNTTTTTTDGIYVESHAGNDDLIKEAKEVQQPLARKKQLPSAIRVTIGVVIGFTVFLFLMPIVGMFIDFLNSPATPDVPNESYAALFIDEARDKILKSPASAQTVSHAILGRIVEHTQDGDIYKFLAYAEVDADNSFGAKIRSNFLIIFRMRGYNFDGVEAFQEYGQEIPSALDVKVFEELHNWPLPKK